VSPVEIGVADAATQEVVDAFARLLPQLSSSATALSHETLTEIIAAPHNTVLLARDPSAGGQIVGTLTLVIFRIPTATRAWIEDVVVDGAARGRGVGEALT
jgi:GNAT superfamily N-acetyltransferase